MNYRFRAVFQYAFFPAVALLTIGCSLWFIIQQKTDLLPQLWVSVIAAILGYLAWFYTTEKLRLDLFDRRFEIYSKTLDYCTVVLKYGSLEPRNENFDAIVAGLNAAQQSFRGIGHHKARALFGPDIAALFDDLNKSYAYISAFGPLRPDGDGYEPDTYWGHVNRTVEVANKFPQLFGPYLYFGDHKQI